MVEQLVFRSLEHPSTNELTAYKRFVSVFCVLVPQRLLTHTVACIGTMQPAKANDLDKLHEIEDYSLHKNGKKVMTVVRLLVQEL